MIMLPLVLSLACAGSAGGSSEPSEPPVYPPKMVKGENVDDDGNALDPKIRSCVEESIATINAVGMAVGGEKSKTDTNESWFGTCWCKNNGFRGTRMDGSCKP